MLLFFVIFCCFLLFLLINLKFFFPISINKKAMTFTCNICKREFSKKWMLDRHRKRIYPCFDGETTKSNFGTSKNNKKSDFGTSKTSFGTSKMTYQRQISYATKNTNDSNNICTHQKNDKKSKKMNELKECKFVCNFCGRVYKHKQSKYNHLLNCKEKKKLEKQENQISQICQDNKTVDIINNNNNNNNNNKKLVNKNIKSKNKIKTKNESDNNYSNFNNKITIRNNINNTIQNQQNATVINNQNIHIHINAFGNENLESITEKDKINILNKVYEAFPEALKTIYSIPENRNFYLPNKREKKYVKVFDGDVGVYEDSNEFKFKLSNIIINKLEEWFDEYNRQIKNKRKGNLKNVFDDFNNGELNSRYFNDIEKYLLTYSNDIKFFFEKEIRMISKIKGK